MDGKGFNQYEAVFLQLADEHKTVNAFELQELLEACLPNGELHFASGLTSYEVSLLMQLFSGLHFMYAIAHNP